MQRLTSALICGVSLFVASAGLANTAEQGKNHDGTWVAVSMEQNGMKIPDDQVAKMAIKLTLKGEDYTVTIGDMLVDKGTSKFNTQQKPTTVDIIPSEGPEKGKKILAIVEMDGDTMKACYDTEGKTRPTTFATKEGTKLILFTYKREMKK